MASGRKRTQQAWAVGRLVAGKLLTGAITICVVSIVIFFALNQLPSDPARAALGPGATPDQLSAFRHLMHLDQPALTRYLTWVGGMIHGDFGTSVVTGEPIGSQILQRLEFTSILGLSALALSMAIALPLAIFAARRATSFPDIAVSGLAIAISAAPEFVVAIAVLLVGVVLLRLFPVSSAAIADGDLTALVLPMVTLALGAAAYAFRHTRVSVVETLSAPYIRAAVLNGLAPQRILWLHVMPNAGVVVVNAVALNAITLLSGVIVVENVFGYPGLGQLLVQSIVANDFPKIEAVGVVTAALLVTINLLADGAVLLLDPRLRTQLANTK